MGQGEEQIDIDAVKRNPGELLFRSVIMQDDMNGAVKAGDRRGPADVIPRELLLPAKNAPQLNRRFAERDPPVLNIEILYKISDRAQVVYIFKSLMVYTLVFIIITAVALVASSGKGLKLRKRAAEAAAAEEAPADFIPTAVEKEENATYYDPAPEPITEPADVKDDHKPTDFGFADIKFFDIALTDCITESISLKKDLVLAEFKFTSAPGSDMWKLAGEVATECFSLNDLRFAVSEDKFAVIFPDRDLHEGLSLCQNFAKSFSVMSGKNMLYAGLSSRNGREMDAERLMTETKAALFKCTDEENIVALETDPEKYRDFICKKC